MYSLARKCFLRQINPFRWQRKFNTSVLKRNEFVLKSSLPDVVIPNMRFIDRIWLDFEKFKDHVAVECAESRKSYTYSQLQKYSATYATCLRKRLALKSGDVIAAMLPNCPEFAVVALGTLQAGCVLTPVNPVYKELEITHQIATTQPKVMITVPECYEEVLKASKNARCDMKIVIVADAHKSVPLSTIRFSNITENAEADFSLLDDIEPNLEDTAVIAFSSGTTGLPKGVELSNKNLFAALESMYDEKTCIPILTDSNFQDILPCVLPFSHVFGLVVTLYGHLAMGSKLITLPRFSAATFFEVLNKHNVSLLFVVPPIAHLLAIHPEVKESFFRNVRHIACGAAPIGAREVEALLRRTNRPVEFNQGYGATETTSLATMTLTKYKEIDYNACGVPMASVSLKFVDPESGDPVPIGQPGEIYVKGPLVMRGYHKDIAATRASITEDGFYKTGDMGHYKHGVGLFVTDRIKELIKVKGMQVAPAELETILRTHPAVQDAAVVGFPHHYYGEVPKAFVACRKGVKPTPEELKTFVAEKVAPHKKIDEIKFVDSIPRTSAGKIMRRELKKLYL